MVKFGPADYSMSIALAGQWDHPRVQEAAAHVIRTAFGPGRGPGGGDEAGNRSEADLPPGALVVKFRRGVDLQAVLRAIGAARQGLAR
jgi:2-keto-3-deoxy-L-rhamnonate aldolase RhmA